MTQCTTGTATLLLTVSITLCIVLAFVPWIEQDILGQDQFLYQTKAFEICESFLQRQVTAPGEPVVQVDPPPFSCHKYEAIPDRILENLCCDMETTMPALGALTLLAMFLYGFAVVLGIYSVRSQSWMFGMGAGGVAFFGTLFSFLILIGTQQSAVWDTQTYMESYPPGVISERVIVNGVETGLGTQGPMLSFVAGLFGLLATLLLVCCNRVGDNTEDTPKVS